MRRILRRCDAISGTACQVTGPPGLETAADALYLPYGPGWGLFARGRSLGETGQPAPGAPPEAAPAPEGAYLYLGPLIPHYGHFLIDALSRLWPLAASGPRPDRLLCHRPAGESAVPDFLAAILAGLGLGPDALVSFDRPVRLARVAVPAKAFREGEAVHAAFGDLCRRVGRTHWSPEAADTVPRPLYLSKARLSAGTGRLLNEAALEAALDRRGAEIVHPETLAFGEQVRLLSRRRMILGPTGSAFHTTAFCAPGRRVIGLNRSHLLNANFPLFDELTGTRGHYCWALHTRYAEDARFGVSWRLADPDRAAAELLERADAFDDLDARDAADAAAEARRARGLAARLRRWRRGLPGRIGAALGARRDPGN